MGAFGDMTAKVVGWTSSKAVDTVTGVGSGFWSLAKTGAKVGIGYGIGTMVGEAISDHTGQEVTPGLSGLIGAFASCAGVSAIHHIRGDKAPEVTGWKRICKTATMFATLGFVGFKGAQWWDDKKLAENNLHEGKPGEYLHGIDAPSNLVPQETLPVSTVPSETSQPEVPTTENITPVSNEQSTTDRSGDELLEGLQTESVPEAEAVTGY